MNIGQIKLNQAGNYVGRIATFQLAMTVALRAVVSQNPRAPKYDIMALNQIAKEWVKVGALFALTSNSTGEEFLNGRIDDPSLAEPVQVSAFRQDDGSYNVVWQRQQRRAVLPVAASSADELPPVPLDDSIPHGGSPEAGGGASTGASTEHGDGLGSSTAPEAPEVKGRKREPVAA